MDGLEDLRRSVRISKQLHRKVEGIELVRLKREHEIRTLVLVLDSSFYVACPSAVWQPINPSTNGGTASWFCKSPVIRIMGFLSGKTGLFPFFLATRHPAKKPDDPIQERCRSVGDLRHQQRRQRVSPIGSAFERTFGATIFFGTDSLTSNARVVFRASISQ